MAQYKKTNTITGKWAKGSELVGVKRAKIVSETAPQPSQFTNKDGSPKNQDVCKVQFEGLKEVLNLSMNNATLNGLIDAFGEDSKNWQGKYLTVETEKMRVGGVARTAIYLIPEGFKKVDDAEGYAVIVRANEATNTSTTSKVPADLTDVDAPVDDKDEDLPF